MQLRNQRAQNTNAVAAPSRPGFALAKLAGEDEPPVSFEAALGVQNFQKYLPVDEEAVNKGVEQFRRHIGKVLKHDSDELEEFIGCMGFSEEEIRKWQQEESNAELAASRVKRLTEGAEKEIREAEQRRRQERDVSFPPRVKGQPAPVPPRGAGGAIPQYRIPGPGRGVPSLPVRGPPSGYRGPMPARGPPNVRGPMISGRGIPPPRGTIISSAQTSVPNSSASSTPQTNSNPNLNSREVVMKKSAAFIERVHQEPVAVTKKELDQHNDQLETEVGKIREQVAKELNERYKKIIAETSTLVEVKNELARVDHVIAGEVANIREKIEVAAAELNEAQQDFDDAEAEFIAAKLNKKMYEDYKAELTEYLVLLIQENQKKKTEKLEELYATLSKSLELSKNAERSQKPFSVELPPAGTADASSASLISGDTAQRS